MNRLFLAVLLLLLACSPQHEATSSGEPLAIAVADTIGVETGDERYVFGQIRGADIDAEGNLLVLDGVTCLVKVYDQEGEYISQFGGRGSGPGELLEPMDICALSGGGAAVSDWEAWGICLYGPDHSYTGILGPMNDGPPLQIAPGTDDRITGNGLSFSRDEDEASAVYFLGSWSSLPEEDLRFLEGTAFMESSPDGRIRIDLPVVLFDTDQGGNLCAAISTDSTYRACLYDPEGSVTAVIQRDWQRTAGDSLMAAVLETEAELLDEELEQEDLYAFAIAGVYLDGERIWIRSGTSSVPFFHLFNMEGVLVDSACVPELTDPYFELEFLFQGNMIYAWNTDPVDYPKIYVLEKPL